MISSPGSDPGKLRKHARARIPCDLDSRGGCFPTAGAARACIWSGAACQVDMFNEDAML